MLVWVSVCCLQPRKPGWSGGFHFQLVSGLWQAKPRGFPNSETLLQLCTTISTSMIHPLGPIWIIVLLPRDHILPTPEPKPLSHPTSAPFSLPIHALTNGRKPPFVSTPISCWTIASPSRWPAFSLSSSPPRFSRDCSHPRAPLGWSLGTWTLESN